MNNVTTLSAEMLLKISPLAPEQLFTGDMNAIRQEFRALAAIWHPDRRPDTKATKVFQHLGRLYDVAITKLRDGLWNTPGLLQLWDTDGSEFRIRYHQMRDFELGQMFIGNRIVTWLISKEQDDLFQNALDVIARLPCANSDMAAEIGRYLPEVTRHIETAGYQVLVLQKTPDLLLLRDVLDHFSGKMDARHVAWIISSLLNLACYLDYAHVAHNAILSDSYFISPQQHSGALLGGWWYAVRQGQPMLAAPTTTMQFAPFDVMNNKRGDGRTDLELIRALGRELLGDITGMRLTRDNAAPQPMIDWLRLAAADSPVDEYQIWQRQILPASFGMRRFTELDLSTQDLY